jgi:hypothetical protein
MRLSLRKLDALLYNKSSRGNWGAFTDSAQKFKWVDYTIREIKDSSIRELTNFDNDTWQDYVGVHGASKDPTEHKTLYLPLLDAKYSTIYTIRDNRYQVYSCSK